MTESIPSTLVAGATTSNPNQSVSNPVSSSSCQAAISRIAAGVFASSASESSISVHPRAARALAAYRMGDTSQARLGYLKLSVDEQDTPMGEAYDAAAKVVGDIQDQEKLQNFLHLDATGAIRKLTPEEAHATANAPYPKPGDPGYDAYTEAAFWV